jgi:capsular exopolysaccharide synthesis family protein
MDQIIRPTPIEQPAAVRTLSPERVLGPFGIAEHDSWVEVHEAIRMLRKHLRLIAALTAACVVLTMVHDLMVEPLYTATATLLIRSTPPRVFVDEDTTTLNQNSAVEATDETQIELLQSRSLAEDVIRSINLAHNRIFWNPRPSAWKSLLEAAQAAVSRWMGRTPPRPRSPGVSASPSDATVSPLLVGAYLRGLNVQPIENTRMVKVGVTTPSPQLSAELANAHANAFIHRGIALNSQAGEQAEQFLQGKLEDLKSRVVQSEVALNQYRRDKGIIPGLISMNGKQDVVLGELNKLSSSLQDAHLTTISLGTEVELIKDHREDALPAVINSRLIQSLKGQVDQEEAKYASLRDQYTPEYPEMQEMRAKIAGAQEALNREIQAAVASVKEQYRAAVERENTLSDELNKEKAFALGLNDAAIKYVMLEREAQTNRELYDAVLKRMKNLAVITDAHASNVSIVDRAQPPMAPSSPKTGRDLIAALLLGIVLGAGAALVIERLDNTLKTAEEAERYLSLPNLATIPDYSSVQALGYGYRPYGTQISSKTQLPAHAAYTGVVSATYGKYSFLAEAYRHLRAALLLSRAGGHPKITLFTSAVPSEGKTTVSVNTATVLAQTGASVLVIDADMRRPRCHRVLAKPNHRGLSEVLTGSNWREMVSETNIENLSLMAAGRIPPNPSELVGSKRMEELLRELSHEFDYVVIDSPPVMLVADALMLSMLADGVVLVAAGGETPKQQVRAALGRLEYANAKVFGIVLNKIRLHKADFPYYYKKGYRGYYVGAGEEAADDVEFEEGHIGPQLSENSEGHS